jgi:hypothetical protein
MATKSPFLRVKILAPRQASAVKRKAERLGMSVDDYVKQLIADDLALDRKARNTSLDELALPFRKALKGASDSEIDRIVESARATTPRRRQ